jgi:transposase
VTEVLVHAVAQHHAACGVAMRLRASGITSCHSCRLHILTNGMPKACSGELRERVIKVVEMGASRRETAERFDVSASSAVKWLQRWRDSGCAAAKPRGGGVSPLEKFATQILAVIAEQSDRTLVETVAVLRKQRIRTSRSSLRRFLNRHNITLKKELTGSGTATRGRRPRAPTLDPRARHARSC